MNNVNQESVMTQKASTPPLTSDPVLKVRHLSVFYETPRGDVRAVDDLDLDLMSGETLGIVGESGCGKSTAAMGILQLVNEPGRIVSGEVWLDDRDLLALTDDDLRKQRWSNLALIPQGAMNSLNPTMTIGAQIKDVIRTHEPRLSRVELSQRIDELAAMVGLPNRVIEQYPHELSGGMKQRVCIAMAVALSPSVIIADEATSALDVIVQRVIAQTIQQVRQKLNVALIMIGHDMGLMAQMATRIAVMYAGKVVEIADTNHLFTNPHHPYTRMLIDAIPSLTTKKPLKVTGGLTHDPRNPPSGCIFRLRCPFATDQCAQSAPSMRRLSDGAQVACHHVDSLPKFTKEAS